MVSELSRTAALRAAPAEPEDGVPISPATHAKTRASLVLGATSSTAIEGESERTRERRKERKSLPSTCASDYRRSCSASAHELHNIAGELSAAARRRLVLRSRLAALSC